MRKFLSFGVGGFIPLILAVALVIFVQKSGFFAQERKNQSPAGMPPLEVDVYKVPAPSSVPVKLTYPARIKSPQKVTVVARVSGVLKKMFFREGSYVREGQLLFLIEPDTYEAELRRAEANLSMAKAELEKAQRDWLRVKKSYEDKVVSEQAKDEALYAYEKAKANLQLAEANLKLAQINYNYTKVTATASGYTGMKLADVGSYVTPNTPLVTITVTDPVYVEFSLPDVDALAIKYGVSPKELTRLLKVKFVMDGGREYTGRLNFFDVNVDEKTLTVRARAELKNPENLLMPGQFVRVEVAGLYRKNAIFVPQQAVIQTPGGPLVFVVENSRVFSRPVKLAELSNGYFVVEKGLKPGDLVVVNNLMKIRDGMPVKIRKQLEGEIR
ncbi:MAG: efflux RND transporter periplasmic adaptor subunit [Hydrogenobacter sp.]